MFAVILCSGWAWGQTGGGVTPAKRGEQLFLTECKACHYLKGLGKPIGPDLSLVQLPTLQKYLQSEMKSSRVRFAQLSGTEVQVIDTLAHPNEYYVLSLPSFPVKSVPEGNVKGFAPWVHPNDPKLFADSALNDFIAFTKRLDEFEDERIAADQAYDKWLVIDKQSEKNVDALSPCAEVSIKEEIEAARKTYRLYLETRRKYMSLWQAKMLPKAADTDSTFVPAETRLLEARRRVKPLEEEKAAKTASAVEIRRRGGDASAADAVVAQLEINLASLNESIRQLEREAQVSLERAEFAADRRKQIEEWLNQSKIIEDTQLSVYATREKTRKAICDAGNGPSLPGN